MDEEQPFKLHTGALATFLPTHEAGKKHPAVLIVHGWKGNVFSEKYAEIASRLNKRGYHVMLLSLRGHEGSSGDINAVSRAEHLDDIRAAFRSLKSHINVDSKNISGLGGSYGAYLLATIAHELQLKQLLLRVPALYPDLDWSQPTSLVTNDPPLEWRKSLHTKEESRALEGFSQFEGEALIVASDDDEYIPKEVIESYRVAKPNCGLHVITGAKHTLGAKEQGEFIEVLTSWFD